MLRGTLQLVKSYIHITSDHYRKLRQTVSGVEQKANHYPEFMKHKNTLKKQKLSQSICTKLYTLSCIP